MFHEGGGQQELSKDQQQEQQHQHQFSVISRGGSDHGGHDFQYGPATDDEYNNRHGGPTYNVALGAFRRKKSVKKGLI